MLTYSELCKFETFEERYNYLRLDGVVAKDTFGFDRYLNQKFYRSSEWKRLRNQIIVRDQGRDLGCEGYEIYGKILIHHMNPVSLEDVVRKTAFLMEPEFLICVSPETHNAIHYGIEKTFDRVSKDRLPGDTCPWRK